MKAKPEILAPAGTPTALQAAVDAGADAVYLGLKSFNMRSRASSNFTLEELAAASAACRSRGVKIYLTLNTIVFDGELPEVEETVRAARPGRSLVNGLASVPTANV